MIRMRLYAGGLPIVIGEAAAGNADAIAQIRQFGTIRNHQLERLYALGTGSDDDPIAAAVAWGTLRMLRHTTLTSPVLTGTLAAAHRGEAKGGEGMVFIAGDAVNPVFGGRPVEYGPKVHEGSGWSETPKPWFSRAVGEIGNTVEAEMLEIVAGQINAGFGVGMADFDMPLGGMGLL